MLLLLEIAFRGLCWSLSLICNVIALLLEPSQTASSAQPKPELKPQTALAPTMKEIYDQDEREARDVYIDALILNRDALRASASAQPKPRNAEELLVKAAKIDLLIRKEIRKNDNEM